MTFSMIQNLLSFRQLHLHSITKCSGVQGIISSLNSVLWRNFSSQSHIVQMRGLDYDTTEQDIVDFFKPLGITPKVVHLKCDGGGRTSSVSEVEFNTHAEAVVAMRKRNAFIGNKFIRLTLKSSEVESEPAKKYEDQNLHSKKVGFDNEAKAKESSVPGGHFLRMKNVPWRTTDQAIYEFFWPVGVLPISIKPLYNESELRNGQFDVQFLSQEDVRKAMAKNNSYLGNKFVELSLKCS